MKTLNNIAAIFGWWLVVFWIAGSIVPGTNFVMCFGSTEKCALKEVK